MPWRCDVPERFMQLSGRTEDAAEAVLYTLPSAAVAGIQMALPFLGVHCSDLHHKPPSAIGPSTVFLFGRCLVHSAPFEHHK